MRIPPFALALALLASGCAGERDALRKEVEALRQEVGRVRATNETLVARIETLELSRAEQAAKAPARGAAATQDDDRPSLDVVRLAPTAEDKPEVLRAVDEMGEEPRPVLRSAGGGAVVAQNAALKTMKQAALPKPAASGKGTAR